MTESDSRLFYYSQSHLFCRTQGPGKHLPGHVDDRLGQEQTSGRFQDIFYLFEKRFLVCDLVDDPEGQNKIHLGINAYGIRTAQMNLNPVRDSFLLGPPQQCIQHFLLNIRGDDPARGANKIGKRDGEVTHSGADVESGFAGMGMGG